MAGCGDTLTSMAAYAHVQALPEGPRWQLLRDHLRSTAEMASGFARSFGGESQAYVAGLWHDLGKYSDAFQAYLARNADASWADAHPDSKRVDHSTAGAIVACDRYPGEAGFAPAMAIAAHHCGLQNYQCFKRRIQRRERLETAAGAPNFEDGILDSATTPVQPQWLTSLPMSSEKLLATELYIRMIFSSLVDADFLDTEAFFNEGRAGLRSRRHDFRRLLGALERHVGSLIPASSADVQQVRSQVLSDAVAAAELEPGLFTLSAPTGSGKTLSSLAFAVRHAVRHDLERVIFVAPFTSILDQTAEAYRRALGELGNDAVVEHHSALDASRAFGDDGLGQTRNALSAENWDAPIIVTTAVQFFESLMANRSSRCRKLHRVARAVVVLDEAQTLPIRLLDVILNAVGELVGHYGTTAMFSTATQPALVAELGARNRAGLKLLSGSREIVTRPNEAYRALVRSHVVLPESLDSAVQWDEIAKKIAAQRQVLAIVGRRDDARRLAELVPGSIHLSAAMCPQHRIEALAEVRRRLTSGEECRVVSTQLVEAGVDLDFPVVYRALAGIDSLVQAAGRCNRSGNLRSGHVEVFVPPSKPVADLRQAYETAKAMLHGKREVDLRDRRLATDFFDRLYQKKDTDPKQIQRAREGLCFEDVARDFQMIPGGTQDVIIPYDLQAQALISKLRYAGASKGLLRDLQRYVVSIFPRQCRGIAEADGLEEVDGRVILLDERLYDRRVGLVWEVPMDVEDFII